MNTPRDYQRAAIGFAAMTLIERRGAGLLMGCGLGKTGTTLCTLDLLRMLAPEPMDRILVAAPSRVLSHWKDEQKAWNTSLPLRVLAGSPARRLEALSKPFAGITVVTHDLLPWVAKRVAKSRKFTLDALVIDEGSKFRTWMGKRTQAARYLAKKSAYRLVLTGTPAPNHSGEIFAQQYLLDLGATLGATIEQFRAEFMYRGGYENRQWLFQDSKLAELQRLIQPWYLHQSPADWLDIPKIVHVRVKVSVPPAVKRQYDRLRQELVAELATGKILAFSGSDKYRYSRQLASGIYYERDPVSPAPTGWHVAHRGKLDTLVDLLSELDGSVMIAYQFNCEREEIAKTLRYAGFDFEVICGGVSRKQTQEIISSQPKILLVQSNSVSHGIDGLQKFCHHLIWFTLPDSGEVYEQLIARLHRSGQANPVIVHYLESVGTIDSAMYRMAQNKQWNQQQLLEGLKC